MSALEDILPDIKRAAARAGRDWAAVTTADDVEQEMVVRLLEADYADRLAGFEPDARAATLGKIATQVANQERVDYDHFTGNFFYSTNDVRKVLDDALSKIRERTVTEELDVDEGMSMLRERNPRYADTIERRFRFKEIIPDSKLLTRAVDALTECMNSVNSGRSRAHTEGPGTRRVVSNAVAQVRVTIQESGRQGEGRS
jgi:DNA-directed RNA polymerase specialized sigma24 family protein